LPKINFTEDAVKIIPYINFKKEGFKVQGEGICVAWPACTSFSQNMEILPLLVCSRDCSADYRGPVTWQT
jgi:hypothetical protein